MIYVQSKFCIYIKISFTDSMKPSLIITFYLLFFSCINCLHGYYRPEIFASSSAIRDPEDSGSPLFLTPLIEAGEILQGVPIYNFTKMVVFSNFYRLGD